MGGGDVKLIGALALWLPLPALIWMLVVMSLIGGAVTLALLIERALCAEHAARSRFPTAWRSPSPGFSRSANRLLTNLRDA